MTKETFQPIAVQSPAQNAVLFKVRCFFDLQLQTIAAFLKPGLAALPPGNVIDIGAGESPWRAWLPSGCVYKGLDVGNSKEFGMSQRNADVLLYDGAKMPLESDSFDGAICIEVLEHARDPSLLIAETARILKRGAPLLLTVPWSARRHHLPFDYHRFTKERLFALLSENGFDKISIEERGNDYCVIFNKTMIASLRNLKEIRGANVFYKAPLALILAFFAAIMLMIAHLSLLFPGKSGGCKEDPLGYFCKAYKKGKEE